MFFRISFIPNHFNRNRNRNRNIPVRIESCDICDKNATKPVLITKLGKRQRKKFGHKLKFVIVCDRHKCHKLVTHSVWLVQTCFCFCLEIWLGTALSFKTETGPQDLAAHWPRLKLEFERASSVKPEKCLAMLTCWLNFARCVDYLFELYADRVGSEDKKRKCNDFGSMAPTINWNDDQVQSHDNHITRPPSSFDKQIHSGDLIMAEFKFQGDFLRYYRYDSQIHPLTVVTWSTLARRTRTQMRAWPARRVFEAMTTMLHSPR